MDLLQEIIDNSNLRQLKIEDPVILYGLASNTDLPRGVVSLMKYSTG